jgi:hypothetical protein
LFVKIIIDRHAMALRFPGPKLKDPILTASYHDFFVNATNKDLRLRVLNETEKICGQIQSTQIKKRQ